MSKRQNVANKNVADKEVPHVVVNATLAGMQQAAAEQLGANLPDNAVLVEAPQAPAPEVPQEQPAQAQAPAPKLPVSKPAVVVQNGKHRQKPGSVGDKLWALYDAHYAAKQACPTVKEATAMAVEAKLNPTSASIALVNWRKFNGYATSRVATPKQEPAPVALEQAPAPQVAEPVPPYNGIVICSNYADALRACK